MKIFEAVVCVVFHELTNTDCALKTVTNATLMRAAQGFVCCHSLCDEIVKLPEH